MVQFQNILIAHIIFFTLNLYAGVESYQGGLKGPSIQFSERLSSRGQYLSLIKTEVFDVEKEIQKKNQESDVIIQGLLRISKGQSKQLNNISPKVSF